MLSTENLAVRPLNVKKNYANSLAYQLAMPEDLGPIHDNCYKSLLKRYVPDEFKQISSRSSKSTYKNFIRISEISNPEY